MNKYLSVLVCALALALGCAAKKPAANPAATAAKKPAATLIPSDQRQLLDVYISSLAALAAKSAVAAEDVAFLKQYGVPAAHIRDLTIEAKVLPADGPYFYLVADMRPVETGIVAEFSALPVPIVWLHDIKRMSVERPYILAHELNHVRNRLVNRFVYPGRTDENGAFRPEWLMDELLTYIHVSLIMDQVSGGQWRQLVMDTVTRRKAEAVKAGYYEDARGIGFLPGELDAIREVFPAPEGEKLEEFGLQLVVDAGLVAVRNECQRTGKVGLAIEEMKQEFMAAFYRGAKHALH